MAALIRCGRLFGRNLGRSLPNTVLPKNCTQINQKLCVAYGFRAVNDAFPSSSVRCYTKLAENKNLLLTNINKTIDNGQMSRQLFASLIDSFEDKAEVTENNVAMLMHICCKGPFDTSLNHRLQMVEDVWNRLNKFGVQPTTKLYNMKLKAYCANKRSFSPLDELATMKSLGLNPDKVTYGLLIEGFNQNGDITGANYVLEAMKEADLNIGVATFNSFITGHLKSGSIEEAENTVKVMRSKGLLPNVDTYFRFAEHFASEGDGDKVLKYIEKAEQYNSIMDQSLLMTLYRIMLQSGQDAEAKKIIPLLAEEFFDVSSMHRLCQLTSEGFSDKAFELYLAIPKVATRKDAPNAGCFLLHSMIINGKNAESVVEMADKLAESNPSTTPHKYAILYAYKYKLTDQALSILRLLAAKNYRLKTTHLIPAICQYKNEENLQGLYEAVSMLMDTEVTDSLDLVSTLSIYCFPALTKLGQSRQDILTAMKAQEKQWNTFFLIEDLRKESCDVAWENIKGKPLDECIIQYLKGRQPLLAKCLPDKWESYIRLVVKMKKCDGTFHGFLAPAIISVLQSGDRHAAEEMFQLIKKQKIRVSKEQISEESVENLPEDIKQMLQECLENQNKERRTSREFLPMKEMLSKTIEELEVYVKTLPNYQLARVVLFKKHLEQKDLPAAQQKLRELEASGFIFPRHELISFIPILVSLGDLESAIFYMKSLKEASGTNYPDFVPLKLAAALLEKGNLSEAVNIIEIATESQMPVIRARDRARKRLLAELIDNAATVQDAETVHKSLLTAKGFLSLPETSIVHRHYVQKLLSSNLDDEDFLQKLEKLNKEYWVFPCMDEVITMFIQKQKKSSLKQVIDMGVNVVGSNLIYHKLACNLVGCGMDSKASAVFESLKNKLNQKAILTSCNYFIKVKKVDCVESLVDIMKTMPINRGLMLQQLISAYVSVDDMEKAIGVLQMYHDEDIIPLKSTLDFISNAFKKNNVELPELLSILQARRQAAQETEAEQRKRSSDSLTSSSYDSEPIDDEDLSKSGHEDVKPSNPKPDDAIEKS